MMGSLDKSEDYANKSMDLGQAIKDFVEAANRVEINPLTNIENYLIDAGYNVEIVTLED